MHEHSSTLAHTPSATDLFKADIVICQAWSRVAQTPESSSNLHAERKRATSHGPGAAQAQFVVGMYQNECFSTGNSNVSQGQPTEVISCPTPFKSSPEAAAQHREISSMLCDHLEGWDREDGRETQEEGDMGIYVYVQLISFVIKQKLTHHCKAIIFQ